MADNVIGILLKGKDEATRVISGVNKEIDKLAGGSTKTATALKLLGSAAIAGTLAKFAEKALDTVVALDKMREESEQISARFLAQAGSTKAAADALSAMNTTVGGALTNDEKMAASGQLMALGLATSAQEAANLANIAINLGDKTKDTAARIEGLTQVMVSGRLVGLKEYGISMQDVNALALKMQSETAGLSDIQAKQNAIMQIGTQKLQEYAAAGGTAVTQTESLRKSWEDYQDALANSVNLGIAKQALADMLRGAAVNLQVASTSDLERLGGLEAKLEILRSQQAELNAKPIKLMAQANQREIDLTIAQIQNLKNELAEESRWGAGAERLTGASREAAQAVDAIDASLADLYAKQEAINVNAVAMAMFRAQTDNTTASMLALGAAIAGAKFEQIATVEPYQDWIGPTRMEADTASGQRKIEARLEAERARVKVSLASNRVIADNFQSELTSAGQAAASKIQGYLSSGISFSKGLSDMTGGGLGGLAPGQNGAFENIYRLQAWLADGSWAETGMKFAGGDKNKGKKIIEDFQRGIFSPEVIGAIDVDALAAEAGMSALAEKSQAAFAKAVADKAGTSTSVIDSILGFKKNEKGVSAADTAAEKSMSQLADSIGAQVTNKDFAGQMIGYGETIWGYTEEGMIQKARSSVAFQTAIAAMVSAAIAGALK